MGIVTFLDAWNSGIYKDVKVKKFTNISPMGWGVAVMAVFIIVYPVYFFNRGRLKTKDGPVVYWILVNVIGALLIMLFLAEIIPIIFGDIR